MLNPDNIIFPDFPLIIAVSGGVDSMVLLSIALRKIPKNHIFVAHFNHNLRGRESDGDEQFVKNFCEKNNLTFFSDSKNISELAKKEKSSIEATARKYRYDFFCRISRETGAKYLLTAHHLDDRIETAMFNLIRGAKFGGISALKRENSYKNITIFRPLLDITKSDILAFASENNIYFREDSTNLQTDFQRNFLRHEILPKFTKINENYQNALKNFIDFTENFHHSQKIFAKNWFEMQNEKYASKKEKMQKNFEKFLISEIFSISDFKNLEIFSRKNCIEYIFHEKNNGNLGLSEGLIDEILRFICE